jgi:restriction system protein
MGFGKPRLCVQVKTGDEPLGRPILDQLIGAMQNFSADQGLLVSWSGFKSSIDKEIPNQFFRVRLWGQKEIIHELLNNYDKLDEDIKAELTLKRIWTLSLSDEE